MGTTNATIRAEMARRGITQIALAAGLGLSQPAVSARLNGRTDWRLSELHTMAAMFGIKPSDLLDDAA